MADRVEPVTIAAYRPMAARYLPTDRVADYLSYADSVPGAHVRVAMHPERRLSADLG